MNGRPDMPAIAEAVARDSMISVEEMRSPARDRRTCNARQLAIWLARREARLSLAEIAGWFGRDYTTALHSTAVVEDRIRDDPKYREFASSLRRQVRAWPASPPARDADAETAREVARLIASAERSLQSATRELERASALCDAMHGHRGRKGRFNRGGTAHQERSDE